MKKLLIMLILTLAMCTMVACDNNNADTDNAGDNAGDNNQPTVETCAHKTTVDTLPKKATCTTSGWEVGKRCRDCNEVVEAPKPIPPLGHKPFTIPAIEPTCQRNGRTQGEECGVCGFVITPSRVIDALKHNEVPNDDVEANCTEVGCTGGTHCSVCFTTIIQGEISPATDHNYETVDDKQVCSKCGDVLGE